MSQLQCCHSDPGCDDAAEVAMGNESVSPIAGHSVSRSGRAAVIAVEGEKRKKKLLPGMKRS